MSTHVTLPSTRVIPLRSDEPGPAHQLWIAEPVEGLLPFPDGPRAVVYVLDANLFFGMAVEMTRLMSQLYGELPPLLVVGLAYGTDVPAEQAALRARDFTPSTPAAWPPKGTPRGRSHGEGSTPELGRAGRLLERLTAEIQPWVRTEYDVADGASTLFGSSLGGLFTLYAMARRPEAFDAWISVSPALWWDEGVLMRELHAFATSRNDLRGRLFLAAGGDEEHPAIPGLADYRMISNARALRDLMASRRFPSLQTELFVPDGESHTTVVPVALTRGLRFVHGRRDPTGPGAPLNPP